MVSLRFENTYNTQVRIDEILYELPYRVETVIDFLEVIIFLCVPNYKTDPDYLIEKYKNEGKVSLYAINKINKDILWTMKEVVAVFAEMPESKTENDFISKEHYISYRNRFKGKSLLLAYIGEFRKLIDATTGQIISSMEVR